MEHLGEGQSTGFAWKAGAPTFSVKYTGPENASGLQENTLSLKELSIKKSVSN